MAVVPFRSLLWRHCFLTASYCCVFLSFGMGVSFLGPTLLDLGCRTGNVFSTMSWIFFSQTFFVLVGSACGGWLTSRFPKHRVLLASVFLVTVTLALIPSCSNLTPLTSTLAVMGLAMGTIDTIVNLSMIQLYGANVGPFLQALHFFYGLGAFLAPMIIEPFLLNVDCTLWIDPAAGAASSRPSVTVSDPITSLEMAHKKSRVQYAFLIMALVQVPVLIMLTLVVSREFVDETSADQPTGETFEIVDKNQLQPVKPHQMTVLIPNDNDAATTAAERVPKPVTSPKQLLLLTAFTGIFLFLVDGFQAVYGNYVYSFAIKTMETVGATEAAYLNALFWGTFSLGRLFSIAIATYASPQLMLVANILGCLVGVSLLLAFYQFGSMLYCGTAVIGLFMSSVYPTSLALVESYINITPPITTCIVVSAAAGEMLLPVIVGYEISVFGPTSFLVTCFVLTVLSLVVLIGLLYVGNSVVRFSAEPGFFGGLRALFCCNLANDMVSSDFGRDRSELNNQVSLYTRMKSDSSEIDLHSSQTFRQ